MKSNILNKSIFLFVILLSFAATWAADVTVTSSTTKWTDGNTYNVTSNETINSRIIVTGTVTLNLGEGKTLTAKKGIELSNGNKLTINGSGTLTATGDTYTVNSVEYWASAIGAFHFGELVINGGTINATGWTNSVGIGGSYSNTGPAGSEKGGSVTINGGTVNATGGYCAPGIGGSKTSTKGSSEGYGITLTINGGKVTARKGSAAEYAIGPGYYGKKTDYTITVGWTNADDFIDHDGLEANPSFVSGKKFARSGETTNITGYAFKTSGKYVPGATVTFEANGGSSVSAQSVAIGSTASKPTAPTRTGYVFAGWTKGDDAYDFGTAVNDDITLTAQWEKQAVVTFNSNGGTDVAVQYVTKGSTANEPIAPTRDGYNFRGWTLGGNPYDFSTAVNDDIELIAQWSAITTLKLSSKTDNTGVLATAVSGDLYNVTLSDRTIFADGSWNTLTLPFSLTASQIAASPLADLTIKEMNTATSGLDGEKLTLNFKDATTIEAGKPYIVKWQADREYDLLIRNKSDWDAFANRVNNGETFEGKTVMLANDFDNSASPVTKMVGYYSWNETNKVATSKPFKGVFDGNGRTLTVNISSNEEYIAPFRSVIGATVKNLTVAGNIQVSHKLVGGMIAFAAGNNLISKCRVSVTITSSVNGDGTVGGFVSNIQGGSTSIENSLFDGSFVGSNTTRWSGFVGWIESMATASHTGTAGSLSISYSLFSPASIDVQSNSGNSTFYRGRSGYTPSLTRYYYTKSFVNGNKQGTDASSKSASTLVSASYLGSNNWEVVSDNAVPKMTTTTTSHTDIVNPTFSNVVIDAKVSTVVTSADGQVILNGTYGPFADAEGLLFDAHNTANGAFYAALGAVGYTVGWFADEGKTTPVTSIPFASDGNATLYAELTVVTYSITYNGVEGASFETANPITYTVESGDILLNNPSKDGYEFAGWTGTGLDAASTNVTINLGSYGNREYTATWKKLLTNTDITIAAIPDQTYTGLAIEPEVTVTDGETTLTLGTDYTVSYSANTNAGTATATITGIGDYGGTVEKTFEIVPKEIIVSWNQQTSFVYNGTEQAPTATAEGLVDGDECLIAVSGAKDVGSHTATATKLSNANYKLPTTGLEQNFEITKAPLTITAKNKTIAYGDEPANDGVEYAGFASEEGASILSGILAYEYNYVQGDPLGEYSITPSGLTADNYEIEFVAGKLTVERKEISVAWDQQTSFVYNGTEQAPTATAEGLVNGDECTITVSGAKDVGSHTATATELSNANYKLPTTGLEQNFEITKATLTVSAKNKTIAYGDEPANDGVEYAGFAGEENASVLGGTLTYGYNYEKGNKTGEYTITPSGLTADNYEINFVSGTLTVESKKLLASGAAQVLQDQNGVRAVLDGEYQTDKEAVNISTDTKVNAVEFKRTFTKGKHSTIMLPFSINVNKVNGADFYQITDIEVKINDNGGKKDTIWGPVIITQVEGAIMANTPYLLGPTETSLSFDIGKEEGVTLNTSKMNPYTFTKEGVQWEFRGTYHYFDFGNDSTQLIKKSYGFAAADQANGLKVGQFRWTGTESFILPMRCYLVYKRLEDGENGNGDGEGEGQGDGNGNGDGNGGAKPQMVKANAPSRSIYSSIPETLEVVIVDEKGGRTVIGTLNTRSGELRLKPRPKHTYDLKGRRVNATRKAKGVYVER